ncbi:serine/threonine protein kinase, CMGC, CDC2/CDK sub [Ceratobasidium sp. 428]|nr:serine/threonine protein kinase, CMGC, CDC2/CDK sub [Ceratobasidium sp. 428]
MDEHGIDLVIKLLTLNPAHHATTFEAPDHDYFWTEPLPCDPSSLPEYTLSHEYDKREKANIVRIQSTMHDSRPCSFEVLPLATLAQS